MLFDKPFYWEDFQVRDSMVVALLSDSTRTSHTDSQSRRSMIWTGGPIGTFPGRKSLPSSPVTVQSASDPLTFHTFWIGWSISLTRSLDNDEFRNLSKLKRPRLFRTDLILKQQHALMRSWESLASSEEYSGYKGFIAIRLCWRTSSVVC